MALLKSPIQIKRKHSDSGVINLCIFCEKPCSEDRSDYPSSSWENIKDTALLWKGLDKYGDVYDKVCWANGPSGNYFHDSCRIALRNNRKLNQAKKRFEKNTNPNLEIPSTDDATKIECLPKKARMSTRSNGVIYDKDLCIWCMKPKIKRGNNREGLSVIELDATWERFKLHTVYIEDNSLRDRLNTFIDATPDPFATEIWYHKSCLRKYFKPTYENSDDSTMATPDNRLTEINALFYDHVRKSIIEWNEPRTLRSLLLDYQNIGKNFDYSLETVKTRTIKQMILNEFPDDIGFHERYHANFHQIWDSQ